MIELGITDIWKAAGVVLGFQVSAFWWRIKREIGMASGGSVTWMPVADYMNIAAIAVCLVGVFTLPIMGVADDLFARRAFGLVILLFIGYAIALAGHYELLAPGTRSYRYFPPQERVVTVIVVVCALMYIAAWVNGFRTVLPF